MKPLNLLFVAAAPWINSGYGKPGRYLFPRLHNLGHTIALAAYRGYEGGIKKINVDGAPVTIFPSVRDGHMNDVITGHVIQFRADAVISLCDIWLLHGWGNKGFNWYPRFPVDTHPISDNVIDHLDGCNAPLPLTKWAQQELISEGFKNAYYIPHGIDCGIYKPMDKDSSRKALELPDTFIAGMVTSNVEFPCRKSIPEVLTAWRDWKLKHKMPGILYLHTNITPRSDSPTGGINIEKILEILELRWSTMDYKGRKSMTDLDVLFPSQYTYWNHGYSDKAISHIYNAMDVLLCPSRAEGFGIPIVESQACGTPVITLGVTSMPELTKYGKCLEPVQMEWSRYGGFRGVPGIGNILYGINWAYNNSINENKDDRDKGIEFARQFDYDAVVEKYWKPFLSSLPCFEDSDPLITKI